MKNLKFLNLLATLDAKTISSFHKYLKRIHGSELITIAVFEYILKFYPDFDDEKKLDLTYIHRKIFKKEGDTNRKRVLNLLADLNLWLKDFLLSEKSKDDSLESRLLWLSVLESRGMEAEFSRQISQIQQEIQFSLPEKSITEYLEKMVVDYIAHNNSIKGSVEQRIETLNNFRASLKRFYEVANLSIDSELANLRNSGVRMLPDIAHSPSIQKQPLLLLYQEIYRLIDGHDEKSYAKIESILSEQAQNIDLREIHNVISYMHNYAAYKIRQGRDEFLQSIHQLNKLGVKYGFFTPKGVLSSTQFTNIVNGSSSMKDFAWAESFIAEQNIYLDENIRGETVRLAKAIVLFDQGKFKEVLQTLEFEHFSTLDNSIRSRTLILRSYYEIDSDLSLDFCIAFETFLYRHQKPKKAVIEDVLSFLKIFKMLYMKKASKEYIINTINTIPRVYFRSWLLEKASLYKAVILKRARPK